MSGRVVALLVLSSAFVVTPLSPAAPKAGGTFRVAEPSTYIDSIDGALANLGGDVPLINGVCASLMRLADKPLPAGFRVVPELAAGFPKISRSGKTYVFTLRKGLRFNTGAPVTAADVAYTINRLLILHSFLSPALSAIVGMQDVLAGKTTHASGIVASGLKLTVRLTQRAPDFAENPAASLCVLPADHPLEPGGVTPPVPSAAPYYISAYVPGQRIVLKRNLYYRGPRPHHVDGFVFDLTVDDAQAVDDVISGSADYAWLPNFILGARVPELTQRFGVNKKQFFLKPSTMLRLFVLNTSRPLFRNNAPLRRAVNFALDRPALSRALGSAETPVDHYLPPVMPGYRNTHVYPLRRPNAAKAKSLARGHTRSGKLVLYVNTRAPALSQAQIVKRDLKRIGLDVQILSFPPGDLYFAKLGNPEEPFDMAWAGFGFPEPDPGGVLNSLFDGGTIGKPGNTNWSYFNSPKWNRALRRASRLTGAARYRAYGRLDVELAREEAPAVAYAVDDVPTLVSARTRCVIVSPALDLAAVCLK